jgi:DNA-directed RNA polymerase subunit RPC12/RpoP
MEKQMDGFKFVDIGNTWSEYKCEQCGKNVVIDMEDPDHIVLEYHRLTNCSPASGGDDGG